MYRGQVHRFGVRKTRRRIAEVWVGTGRWTDQLDHWRTETGPGVQRQQQESGTGGWSLWWASEVCSRSLESVKDSGVCSRNPSSEAGVWSIDQ